MKNANELLEELAHIRGEYEKQLKRFCEFVAEIQEVISIDARLAGIDLDVIENNLLKIRFIDKELHVKYSYFLDKNNNQKGRITCYDICSTPDINYKVINSFCFDGLGTTDISINDERGPYVISTRPDAVNILLYWLRTSLDEDS
ncbi:MAG: hypothetical protein KZQ80_14310 [Candidatus Thiodiazotropha sp. (ex Monitilora ramsayi)]|nr:hypothetical protein [Candidatus Thiodiazotropha sp. (ex Monitilora ramsayi)]